MKRLANVVHNLGESLSASARALLPLFLLVLLAWFLVETSLAVWASQPYRYLAILIWLMLAAVALTGALSPVVKWKDALDPARPADPSLALPLVFWNVGLILVVMYMAELWTPRVNFATPLLNFYQFLFRRITG